MVSRRSRQNSPLVHAGGAFSVENPYEYLVRNLNHESEQTWQEAREAAAAPNIVEVTTAGTFESERQAQLKFIRDRIINQPSCHYIRNVGFCLDHHFKVKDIEDLLVAIDLIEDDVRLTAEDLRSEQVCAALREFNIHLPSSTYEPPTGERPPEIADKALLIPSQIGYTSPSLSKFIRYHLLPLLPAHELYPEADTTCVICHQLYDDTHTPVLIVNCSRCKGHIFGYACLRQHISSGRSVFNSCPICRTKWFKPRRSEAAMIRRQWLEVSRREKQAVEREREAFDLGEKQVPLAVRTKRVLMDCGLVTVEIVKVAVVWGVRWITRTIQE